MSSQSVRVSQAAPSLASHAYRVLTTASPCEKVRLTEEAFKNWNKDHNIGTVQTPPSKPARPERPEIVAPNQLLTPKNSPYGTNVHYLHSLAHVELNAIDLCFDTMLRFPSDLESWYDDWISIAADEARHFTWLNARLYTLGLDYGILPAHDIIWRGADASSTGCKERLAIGQLVAEARGLDAGPRIAQRLVGAGDLESARVVGKIADEELRHVQIGVKWFIHECQNDGSDPIKEFQSIALRLSNPGAFSPPFDEEKRRQAGLEPEWYLPVAEQMKEQVQRNKNKKKGVETDGTKMEVTTAQD